ncbi:hypothetical protein ABZW30_22060 [Kitasatospora sp. NPDC004669]|uniref:hypothetical protein n=1 Tax=Kitasatospora sp. NPDC004669 TaxID=3154555 RepID=UPI0033A268DB
MRSPRRFVAPLLTACVTLAGAVAAAPAGPAELRPLPVPDGRYCAAVLGRLSEPEGASPVLGRACSAATTADVLALADGRSRAAEQLADRTLLLEEYKDVDYGGDVIYSFYGDAGGCDATGYRLVGYFDVALSVSSMRGYSNCNTVHLRSTLGKEEAPGLPAGYPGPDFNDAVRESRVFHG